MVGCAPLMEFLRYAFTEFGEFNQFSDKIIVKEYSNLQPLVWDPEIPGKTQVT